MEKNSIENPVVETEVEQKTNEHDFIKLPNGTTMDVTNFTRKERQDLIEQLRESLNER